VYLREKESNQFKFLVSGAGAVIPAKQIFQLQIESLKLHAWSYSVVEQQLQSWFGRIGALLNTPNLQSPQT
jgi:hypothetical protein